MAATRESSAVRASSTLPRGDPASLGLDPTRLMSLVRLVESHIADNRYPGAQVAMARDGKLALLETLGDARIGRELAPATDDMLWLMFSQTKVIVAAAVWQLVDDGVLRFADRIADHISGFDRNGKGDITLYQLLSHQAGFPETVATLGTALTEAQVDLLRRYGDRIVLLFDSDEAGEAAADRAIRVALPRCVTVALAKIPDGKDPSEFLTRTGASAFSDLLNGAVDALEFKWFGTQERFAGGRSDARRREAILDFLRVVAAGVSTSAVDAIQRGLLVNP